jgi:chromosome partitioning protein
MAIKIVVANKKGGVGKTTCSINLAAFLSEMGKKTLLVDLDSQSNLAVSFKMNVDDHCPAINDVFLGRAQLDEVLTPISTNLSLVPSRKDLEHVINSGDFAKIRKRDEVIKFRMGKADEDFDWIIFDTQPAIESILTMNALATADYALIPLELGICSLYGLAQVMDVIAEVQNQWLNNNLRTIGFLINRFEKNDNDARHHLEILMQSKYAAYLFKTKIRKNAALKKSITAGVPINKYDLNSHGYRDYRDFTDELLERVATKNAY